MNIEDEPMLPVWFELHTPDRSSALSRYTNLTGWDVVWSRGYPMLCRHGRPTGGVIQAAEARWVPYLPVDDVDAAAARAIALGGALLVPPADADDLGRRARVADPTGAVFELYRSARGATPPPGLPWRALYTPDPARAAGFYAELLGICWGEPGADAALIADPRAGWVPWFGVEDLEGAAARAVELGVRREGEVWVDPEGARFGLAAG